MPTTVGTVYVDVKFNVGDIARQLQTQLGAAAGGAGVGAAAAANMERTFSQAATNIGTKMQSVGRQMSMFVTLPLTLIGKSAVSSFQEFDKAMTQVAAINQVNAETTDQWRTEVRDLGRQYGVSAEEAAKGLYFITSSGVETADAMDVLNVAMKASAVGFGETKVVADVLTSALSAYRKTGLTAVQVGDELAAAVRLGKGEADDLAGSLSQVIPIAANLGIKFGEVAGAMAAMSLSGTSTDQAATQLRGLFNTLADMPPISERALTQYTGLNAETLKLNLSSKGLIPTLKQIFDGFGDNKIAMAEVFGNIRALTGIYNLFGNNMDKTLEIVKKVTEASGDLNAAWEITAKSKSKQLELSMNTLHDAFVGLGSTVVPMVTSVTNVLGAFAQSIDHLPGPLKAVTVGFAGLAAVAGPLVVVSGTLVRSFGSITRSLEESGRMSFTMSDGMKSLGKTLGTVSATLALGATAWALYANAIATAEQRGREMQELANNISLTGGIGDAEGELGKIDGQIAQINKEIDDFTNVNYGNILQTVLAPWSKAVDLDYFLNDLPKIRAGLEASKKPIQDRINLANQMAAVTGKTSDETYRWLAAQAKAGNQITNLDQANEAYNKGLLESDEATLKLATSNVVLAGSIEEAVSKAKAAGDMFFALRDAEAAVDAAREKQTEAAQKVLDAQDHLADAQKKSVEASRKEVEAQGKVTEAIQKTADARRRLADAQNELNDALRGPSESEQISLESARLGVAEAQKRARETGGDPLDRRRAQLDLRRARLDLTEAQGQHAKRIADAQKGVVDAQSAVNDALQAEVDARQAVIDAREAKIQADKNVTAAADDVTKAEKGVRDAAQEVFDALNNLTGKQAEFDTALYSNTINANWLREYLIKLRDMYPELGTEIDKYMAKIEGLQAAAANKTPGPPAPVPPPAPVEPPPPPPPPPPDPMRGMEFKPGVGWQFKPNRAVGGPLSTGQLSRINERGVPELWSAGGKQYLLPTANGQVSPLKPLDINVDAKGGDGVSVGDIYVQGANDPVQTAYEVRRQLRVKTRTKARS